MTARKSRKKSNLLRIALTVLVVAIVGILVFAVSFGISALKARDLITNAETHYEQASQSFENGDISLAMRDAKDAISDVNELSNELSGVQWSIAAALPVIGPDVQTAQEFASIAQELSNEGVLPLIDLLEELPIESLEAVVSGNGTASSSQGASTPVEGLMQTVDTLSRLPDTLSHSADVVDNCEKRSNSLSETHISQLNEASKEMKELLDSAKQVADDIRSVFDAISKVTSIFTVTQ